MSCAMSGTQAGWPLSHTRPGRPCPRSNVRLQLSRSNSLTGTSGRCQLLVQTSAVPSSLTIQRKPTSQPRLSPTARDGLDQRAEHLIDRLPDERRRIVVGGIAQPFREARSQFVHLGFHAIGGVQRIRAGQQVNGESRRRPAVEPAQLVLALGPQVGPADIPEVGDLAVAAGLEDDVGELLGLGQPAEGAQGVLEVRKRSVPGRIA